MKVVMLLSLLALVLMAQSSSAAHKEKEMDMMGLMKKLFGSHSQEKSSEEKSSYKKSSYKKSSEEKSMSLEALLKALKMDESESESKSESESESSDNDSAFKKLRAALEKKFAKESEEKECEERKKRMDALEQKQMMLKKMQNITMMLEEQKAKLNHDATFQFLEFCKCSDSSNMIKGFLMHKFGDLSYMTTWDSVLTSDREDSLFNNVGEMKDAMMNMGNMTVDSTSSGNSTGNSSEEEGEGKMMLEKLAEKLSKLDHEEISKHLFNGLVDAMCEGAKEAIEHAKKIEKFYVAWKSEHYEESDESD